MNDRRQNGVWPFAVGRNGRGIVIEFDPGELGGDERNVVELTALQARRLAALINTRLDLQGFSSETSEARGV